MTQDNVEKQPPVPPFVRFVASAVPMVFDNSLSYYEAICAMWKYLSDTVNVINNNATVTEEYIQLTKDMKEYMDNYFDNLDVQEEINTKLDAMVEDGTLQEIITTYIQSNVAWTFDTVADMKSATNLIAGSYARTLGFYSLNDGGGAFYYISDTGTANEKDVIAVDTLYANLILEPVMTPNQFGALGDGLTDDSSYIQYALAHCPYIKLFSSVYLAKNIEMGNYNTLDGNGKTLKIADNTKLLTNNYNNATVQHNITIKNLVVDCDDVVGSDEQNNLIYLCGVDNCLIDGVIIDGSKSDGIYIGTYNFAKTNTNVRITNCKISNSGRNNISVIAGEVLIDNCQFDGGTVSSIDVEPNIDSDHSDVTIRDCIITNGFINGYVKTSLIDTKANININNCRISSSVISVYLQYMNNVIVDNNVISSSSTSNYGVVTLYTNAHNIVRGNIVNSTTSIAGIRVSAGNNSDIVNNVINTAKYGLEIIDSSRCLIEGNKINNSATMGIYNRGTTTRNNYSFNTIVNGGNYISTNGSSYELICGNICSSDNAGTTRGIQLASDTSKFLVVNNIVTDATQYAIRDSGTNNTQDNNITS